MILKCLGYTNHRCKNEFETHGTARKRCPKCSEQRHLELVKKANRSHPRKSRAKHYNKAKVQEQIRPALTYYTPAQLMKLPPNKLVWVLENNRII